MLRRFGPVTLVFSLLAGGLVALGSWPAAVAQAPTGCNNFDALGPAGGFAEFIHHNSSRVSDSEGRVAIGGDATLGISTVKVGFSIGSGQPADSIGVPLPPDPNRNDLIVGGNLDAYNVDLINGGAVYGSLTPGSVVQSHVPGASIKVGPPTLNADGSGPLDFDAIFQDLEASSAYWAGLPANGTTTVTQFPTGLDLVGTASTLNVFSVTAAELNSATFIQIKVPQGATILVNVSGTSINMNQGPLGTVSIWDPVTGQYIVDNHFINGLPVPSTAWLTLRQSLLWNFSNATTILKNGVSWPGTILAPNAQFQFGQGTAIGPGHIDGSLIADSVVSVVGAETHDMAFVGGCLPSVPVPTGSVTIVKQISGPPPDADEVFGFSVDCGSDGGSHQVTITVTAGQTSGQASLDNLPVGAVCTITETSAPPGFDLVNITPNPVTVPASGDPAVTVTALDTHEIGDLSLVKSLDIPTPVDGTVTLHVSCTDGTTEDVDLTVPAGSQTAATTIGGIAVGAVCLVTETAAPPDWQMGAITPSSVVIGPDSGPVATVTANDTVLLGSLDLTKQTTTPPTTDTDFTLHVDCGTNSFQGDVTITEPAGATSASAAPITDLPYGTTCAVTEPTLPTGWALQSITPESVTIGAGGVATATVTAVNAATNVGDLQLVKDITGPSDGQAHTFTLHVSCTDGAVADVPVTVPAGDTTGSDTLTGLTPGASCTVSEPTVPAGFSLTSISPNPVTIGAAGTPPVVVTATNAHLLGSLEVSKQLTAPATSASQFEFTLDCDGTAFDRTISVDVAAGATSGSTVLDSLPVDLHCDLTEPQPPPGYEVASISPTDGMTVGSGPPVTITATDTATTGAVAIVKQLTGGVSDLDLPIALNLTCTNPALSRQAAITLPSGATSAQTVETGLPIGAQCAVTESTPPAPLAEVGVSPATVTVGAGQPVTVTVTNSIDSFNATLTKQVTAPTAATVTFGFLAACNDPVVTHTVAVTVPAGGTQATLATGIPGNVACTFSEPESPAWTPVSRTPTDGTVTDVAPSVAFVNRAVTGVVLAATGFAGAPFFFAAGMGALLCGTGFVTLSKARSRRRRAD